MSNQFPTKKSKRGTKSYLYHLVDNVSGAILKRNVPYPVALLKQRELRNSTKTHIIRGARQR